MNNNALVSVVVPVWNSENYIRETLESVRKQSYTNLEVVIVDDGSTDGTLEILQEFLVDPRLRLLKQKNAGVASALNEGIRVANGDFVAILGSDDIWLADKIERQIEIAAANPEFGLIFCNALVFSDLGEHGNYYPQFASYPRDDLIGQLLEENPFCASTIVIRSELFERFGVFDESFIVAEDYELWTRYALNGVKAIGTTQILHRQRLRHDSLTFSKRELTLENVLRIWHRIKPQLSEPRLLKKLRRSIRTTKSDLLIERGRRMMEKGNGRQAAVLFLKAWRFRTSRRWLLRAAFALAVTGEWKKPEQVKLGGWLG